MLADYLNLRDLVAQLPADFMRVSGSMKAIHREIIASFCEDARATGEVIQTYLTKSDHLTSQPAIGEAQFVPHTQWAIDMAHNCASTS